jgi:hypothetical protein
MKSVTVSELTKHVLDLLGGLKEGEAVDVSLLRDGSVLLRRADASQT